MAKKRKKKGKRNQQAIMFQKRAIKRKAAQKEAAKKEAAKKEGQLALADLPLTTPDQSAEREVWRAFWDRFNDASWESQITVSLHAMREGKMSGQLAFDMLHLIYEEGLKLGDEGRTEFNKVAETLAAQAPEAYESHGHYFLKWQIANALAMGQIEQVQECFTKMVAFADTSVDDFNHVVDQLRYHGHLSILLPGMLAACPAVKVSENIVPWGIDEFMGRTGNCIIFDYLQQSVEPYSTDPVLLTSLNVVVDDLNEEYLDNYISRLSRRRQDEWRLDDFGLPGKRKQRKEWYDEEEEDEFAEGRQNLSSLTFEFLGYAHHEEGVSYLKGEMARVEIYKYLLERHAGELVKRPSMMDRILNPDAAKHMPKPRKPDHILVPDYDTLQ